MQDYLAFFGVPYVGSSAAATAGCADKLETADALAVRPSSAPPVRLWTLAHFFAAVRQAGGHHVLRSDNGSTRQTAPSCLRGWLLARNSPFPSAKLPAAKFYTRRGALWHAQELAEHGIFTVPKVEVLLGDLVELHVACGRADTAEAAAIATDLAITAERDAAIEALDEEYGSDEDDEQEEEEAGDNSSGEETEDEEEEEVSDEEVAEAVQDALSAGDEAGDAADELLAEIRAALDVPPDTVLCIKPAAEGGGVGVMRLEDADDLKIYAAAVAQEWGRVPVELAPGAV